MQLIVSSVGPSQSEQQPEATLVRVCVPAPQVTLHAEYSDQSPHEQSTGGAEKVIALF